MITLFGPMDSESEVLYKYELDITIRSGSDGQYIGKCHGEVHFNPFELSGITILVFDNYSSIPIKAKREIDISFYSSPVRSFFKGVEKPIDASLDITNQLGVHRDGNGEMKSSAEVLNYIGCWKDLRP